METLEIKYQKPYKIYHVALFPNDTTKPHFECGYCKQLILCEEILYPPPYAICVPCHNLVLDHSRRFGK